MAHLQQIHLELPDWFHQFHIQASAHRYTSDQAAMEMVLELTRLNIHNDGGPFGAAILAAGEIVSLGINRVVADGCSLWHAETVAIALAQRACGTHRLGVRSLLLVSSCEPCCMCLGALLWSGISEVVCGARDADARAVGFDEGPKPDDWVATCGYRNIDVRRDVGRYTARSLLEEYVTRGGAVYNG